jgi:anti-sigma factor RsiW
MTRHLTDEVAQAYVDRALTAEERARWAGHLDRCAECGLLVDSYRALTAALDSLDAPVAPAGFTAAVMEGIELSERQRAWNRRLALGILGVATFLALVLVGVAGSAGWALVLSGAAGAFARAAAAASLAVEVGAPLVRALRLQIAIGCGALVLPILFALSRLVPRAAAASA